MRQVSGLMLSDFLGCWFPRVFHDLRALRFSTFILQLDVRLICDVLRLDPLRLLFRILVERLKPLVSYITNVDIWSYGLPPFRPCP